MAYYIGLDLGGTNVKAGLMDDAGRAVTKLSVPTEAEQGPGRVVEVLAKAAKDVLARAGIGPAEVRGVGVGAPGVIDHAAGEVIGAPNLRDFRHVPLQRMLEERTGLRVFLENDANAAAMGEYWVGAGRDASVRNMVMLTLGTGVGGGIIIDGHVFRGGKGLGAEIGHMILIAGGQRCGCGQRGCIEAYASATGTARRAREALESGVPSVLRSRGEVTAEGVFEAAKAGDPVALKVADETAFYLATACISLSRVLDPDLFVFAGGMALAGEFLFDRIRAHIRAQDWSITPWRASIVGARLGNDAGFIGAAAVAWDWQLMAGEQVQSA